MSTDHGGPSRDSDVDHSGGSHSAEDHTTVHDGAVGPAADDGRAEDEKADRPWASVTACPNGPLLVRGDVEILLADGEPAPRRRRTVALCRCGASAIKPYCDGSHKVIGFRTDDEPRRSAPPEPPDVPATRGGPRLVEDPESDHRRRSA